MKNYYHILGLSNIASMDKIKAAYRRLALVHHPDRGGSLNKMVEINAAYEYLVKNKESYDRTLKPSRPSLKTSGFTIEVGGFGNSWTFGTSRTSVASNYY